jgi:hypothetical protein
VTYEDLLNRIIADGIAEVREAYGDPKAHHKRDGAIEGFEACRGKAPSDLVALWTEAEQCAAKIARESRENASGEPLDYWRQRYKTLQIEFVCNVVSVGLVNSGQAPLLGHLPTSRGAMKYAAIVGVQGQGAEA